MAKPTKSIVTDEEWRVIDWIPNLNSVYEVSSNGNVRRISTKKYLGKYHRYADISKVHPIKAHDNGTGYMVVHFRLANSNKRVTGYIHRLVAIAFIPNPERKTQVNHKDHNRGNNEVSNLEWVTAKENLDYSKHLRHHPMSSSLYNPLYGIRKRGNRYEVRITTHHIGMFATYNEAVKARDEYVKEYYN